jgi:hypothetical protein
VSPRTLQNWRRDDPKRSGRPPHSAPVRWQALRLIVRELRRQGYGAGWRPVSRALGDPVPVRLVQWYVPRLKWRHAQRVRRRRERLRQHIEVHHDGAIWSIDGAQMGRESSAPVRAEIVRDVGAQRTVGIGVAKSIDGPCVIAVLEATWHTHAELPLVIASDNGSENCNEDVGDYLDNHRVIHLRSMPRTPQHNPWAEHGIGELRRDAEIDSDTPVAGVIDVARRLQMSCWRVDHERWRPPRARPPTGRHGDSIAAARYTPEYRERFYRAARDAVDHALVGREGKRERRRARREAILATLEQFGEITRTWGSGASSRVERERVS